MAQFVVRNLEDDVRDKLRELARREGRSMEEMVRDILRNAVLRLKEPEEGLGTRLANRFAKHGLKEPLPELPRQSFEPIIIHYGKDGNHGRRIRQTNFREI